MKKSDKLSILEFMEKHNLYLIKHYNAYALCTDLAVIGRVFLAESSLNPPIGVLSKDLPIKVYETPIFIGDINNTYSFISDMMFSANLSEAVPITPQDLGLEDLRKTSINIDLV